MVPATVSNRKLKKPMGSGPHYLYRPRPGVKACLNCGKPVA